LTIELSQLPVQEGVGAVAAASGADVHELAAGRGEDYELLVTLPPERLGEAGEALAADGVALTEIGGVREGTGVTLRELDGSEREPTGFDQLRR
jgi:thiamine-monophosphate kinase